MTLDKVPIRILLSTQLAFRFPPETGVTFICRWAFGWVRAWDFFKARRILKTKLVIRFQFDPTSMKCLDFHFKPTSNWLRLLRPLITPWKTREGCLSVWKKLIQHGQIVKGAFYHWGLTHQWTACGQNIQRNAWDIDLVSPPPRNHQKPLDLKIAGIQQA